MSIVASKDTIKLGETVTVTYTCSGAFKTTIRGDNMPSELDLGDRNVSGAMSFLPVVSGIFNVYLTAYGVVHQAKGIDKQSDTETNVAHVSITVN